MQRAPDPNLLGDWMLYEEPKGREPMAKGWRTILVAVGIAAVGAVQQVGLVDVVPAQYVGFVMMALGFVMSWLRSVTNTPVGGK